MVEKVLTAEVWNKYKLNRAKQYLEGSGSEVYARLLRTILRNVSVHACPICGWRHLSLEEFKMMIFPSLMTGRKSILYDFFEKKVEDCHFLGPLRSYRGEYWRRHHNDCLAKSNFICQVCLTDEATAVHHILPYRFSHINLTWNLIAVCNKCHEEVEKNPSNLPLEVIQEVVLHIMCLVGEENWDELFQQMWVKGEPL
ncbi:MAG: HNH endonuclease [Desulfobacterales bacterium]|nr:HNH endonuclease [Desulfobacterales bacterium]